MIKNPPIIKEVVRKMGGTIGKVIPERGYFYINIRGERILVSRKFNISANLIAGSGATKFKDLTYILLKEYSLPTPKTVCFYKKTLIDEDIDKKLETLKFPVIIKDAQGSNSKGIFANIANLDEAKKIIQEEIIKFRSLVVQEMVFGKEFRVLVLKDKVIGVLELIPPRIFGDGENTVRSLIIKKQERLKQKTAFDSSLDEILEKQGHALDSVPERGREIYIKKNSCLAEGGETREVTTIIHEDIKKICIKATKVIGKYLGGIDIICDDISKSPERQNFNILEINGKPDLYIHYNPTYGKTRDVVKDIIEFILELRKNNA